MNATEPEELFETIAFNILVNHAADDFGVTGNTARSYATPVLARLRKDTR